MHRFKSYTDVNEEVLKRKPDLPVIKTFYNDDDVKSLICFYLEDKTQVTLAVWNSKELYAYLEQFVCEDDGVTVVKS